MPILNYTTKIDAAKTAGEVQAILAKAGAKAVAIDYSDQGRPIAISFRIATEFGDRDFMLPVRAEQVQMVLRRQKVASGLSTFEHAQKVAWRIVKDWTEAQLAIIQTEMVTLTQIMLPYMVTPTGTVFENYQNSQPQLGAGTA